MEVNENLSEKAQYDYLLVRRAVDRGYQKAYAELMSRYRDSIYFMLLKMINNKDDAEDLTIEAFQGLPPLEAVHAELRVQHLAVQDRLQQLHRLDPEAEEEDLLHRQPHRYR